MRGEEKARRERRGKEKTEGKEEGQKEKTEGREEGQRNGGAQEEMLKVRTKSRLAEAKPARKKERPVLTEAKQSRAARSCERRKLRCSERSLPG